MGYDNEIHSTAIVHPDVVLGHDNYIGPFCVIGPNVNIGDRNRFEAHVSIGQPAEHHAYFEHFGRVDIGDYNVIREFVTINGGTFRDTLIRSGCIMLRNSHLSHDSVLENGVTVSCNALIGGESYVMKGANLGLGSIVHQRQVIGAHAMLGMGAVVSKGLDVLPGKVYTGIPARYLKDNLVGLERDGVSEKELYELTQRYYGLRHQSK